MENNEERELMAESAIANVSMLYQVASGKVSESPERMEKRFAALVTYLRTGSLAADADDLAFVANYRAWLSTQPVKAELAAAG